MAWLPFQRMNMVFGPVLLALGLASCGGATDEAVGAGPLRVVASTNVWGSVVNAVGGDRVRVTALLNDPAADPHAYEATPGDVVAIQAARLVVYNGGGYDDFFTRLSDQAPGVRKLVAFDIATSIEGNPERKGNIPDQDRRNEHVWYDFSTVSLVADQVATQLGELDPEAKPAFRNNATRFKDQLGELIATVEGVSRVHPSSRVVATEPVAAYLLDLAKTTDVTPPRFSQAIEEETDVPAAALSEVQQLLRNKQVKVLVHNVQTETPVTNSVVAEARTAGLPIVEVTETLPAGVTGYIAWMRGQVENLARVLGGS